MKILEFVLTVCLVLSLWQAVFPMTVSHNLKTNYGVLVSVGKLFLPTLTKTRFSSAVAFSYVFVLRGVCVGKSVRQTLAVTDYG